MHIYIYISAGPYLSGARNIKRAKSNRKEPKQHRKEPKGTGRKQREHTWNRQEPKWDRGPIKPNHLFGNLRPH